MLYAVLRAINAVCLRWYYSRIDVEGIERLPATGPALLAVNHPNSLVDSMITAFVFKRRLTFTARATLFTNPIREPSGMRTEACSIRSLPAIRTERSSMMSMARSMAEPAAPRNP